MDTNHPIVQIFYILIAVGGYYILNVDSYCMKFLVFLSLCLVRMCL